VFCYRQLQSLEHSVASDLRLILTILQQQHAVRSSESSGSSMMPDYREVRSKTFIPFMAVWEGEFPYFSTQLFSCMAFKTGPWLIFAYDLVMGLQKTYISTLVFCNGIPHVPNIVIILLQLGCLEFIHKNGVLDVMLR